MKARIWLFVLALAALLAAALSAVFLRDWVRETIVAPMAYFFWVVGLLLQTFSQGLYWTLLVLLAFGISAYALRPRAGELPGPEPQRAGQNKSRYSQWRSYINNLEDSRFACDTLARELIRLTAQILAYQQNTSTDEIYQQIDAGEISLPPDFLAFLRRREFIHKPAQRLAWREFLARLPHKKPAPRPPDRLVPVEREVETILEHIENLLAPQEILLEVDLGTDAPQPANS